jgi:hypothetical protein
VAIQGLAIAKEILADEESRRKLGNRTFCKALDSRAYGLKQAGVAKGVTKLSSPRQKF